MTSPLKKSSEINAVENVGSFKDTPLADAPHKVHTQASSTPVSTVVANCGAEDTVVTPTDARLRNRPEMIKNEAIGKPSNSNSSAPRPAGYSSGYDTDVGQSEGLNTASTNSAASLRSDGLVKMTSSGMFVDELFKKADADGRLTSYVWYICAGNQ
ncbi:hypothetical protein SARC_07805 [Sphaeroforma arctica JP610]|uniref:Uncharacterized protein n=1 Tax=Sphaeroforma arctica JP610 TaxID=667725 RepID=A0A0L0FTB4_9EUKA|nr:hypothetical protein SARC_07805 [Sphaeroforma arctica JP610]KNC79816.1 hypothetical protein SARC_07805 [Sphaeroforma arctica JP610]|eukprot:XP_014153718.1 hypothetical protein SARC_07805 [Sphaeroforma arctica JP610]